MQVHWPLVISTACQRAGLGLFVCAWIANLLGAGLPMWLIALITLLFLAVGGCASIFHLQRPQRFFNAFSNPKSHLTQEGAITPFLGIGLLLVIFGVGGIAVEAITFILALAFLLVTGKAYQMNSRPAWNTYYVLALFLLTALSAGFVGCVFVAACTGNAAIRALVICAVLALGACEIVQVLYINRMAKVGYGVAYDAFKQPYRPYTMLWQIALFFAVVLVAITMFVAAGPIATACALLAEVCIVISIAAWTALFFKGAHKVKMFPMYPVDLNLDM